MTNAHDILVKETPAVRASWVGLARAAGVTVVHVDLSSNAERETEAFAWLDGAERSTWEKGVPVVRRRFSLCRAALRAILCSRLGCSNEQLSFGASSHGKPFAVVRGARSPVNFNVSHGGIHGLIAVAADGRVGVDIEERVPRRNLHALIESTMGPDEQAELAALRGAERLRLFYRLWTLKEALIKALGTGFSTDPSQFQVPSGMRSGDASGTFRFPHLPSVAWGLREIGNEEFAAALAYEVPSDDALPDAPGSNGHLPGRAPRG